MPSQAALTQNLLHLAPFMISHMCSIMKKKGTIYFGGLITSLARAMGLDTELATIEPLPPTPLTLTF